MKKYQISGLIIMISLFFACSQTAEDMVVGKWQLSDIKTSQDIDEAEKEDFNKAMEEMKKSTNMILNQDKTYESTINGVTTKGNWEVDSIGTRLTFTDESGLKTTSNITELSKNKLILEEEGEGVVSTLIFTK